MEMSPHSSECKRETERIHRNSVDFWNKNKKICRWENALARKKSEKKKFKNKEKNK